MYEKEPKVIIRNKDYGTTKRLVVKSRLDIVEEGIYELENSFGRTEM